MDVSKIEPDLDVIVSPTMQNNTYIIYQQNDVIIIDPSFSGDEIINHLGNKYKVIAVFLTHAHFDHTFHTAKICQTYNCPVYMLDKEKETYELYDCSNWFDNEVPSFMKYIKFIKSGIININNSQFVIIHTPGHTSGGMTIIYKNYVFSGDTLFYDSYGRTDLYNSSQSEMKKSIDYLFKNLEDNQLLLPGHGKWGKFKIVKENNWIAQSLLKE